MYTKLFAQIKKHKKKKRKPKNETHTKS